MFWFVFFLIKVIYYLIKLLPSINSLSIYILPNPYGFTSTFLKKYYLNRLLWYSFLPKSQQLNTYYHKVLLNYSLFDTAWQFSTFGVILVRIWTDYFRIQTLFTQCKPNFFCNLLLLVSVNSFSDINITDILILLIHRTHLFITIMFDFLFNY